MKLQWLQGWGLESFWSPNKKQMLRKLELTREEQNESLWRRNKSQEGMQNTAATTEERSEGRRDISAMTLMAAALWTSTGSAESGQSRPHMEPTKARIVRFCRHSWLCWRFLFLGFFFGSKALHLTKNTWMHPTLLMGRVFLQMVVSQVNNSRT